MSDLTEKEYNTSVSEEDYPVLFGAVVNSKNAPKITSVWGTRSDTHGDLEIGIGMEDTLTWRYVPLTKTLYWWYNPSPEIKTAVVQYIYNKYHQEVKRNTAMDTEVMISNHSRRWTRHHLSAIPSFQEWYKAHQGD